MSFRPAAVVTVVVLLWYTEEEFLSEPSEIIQQLCVSNKRLKLRFFMHSAVI